MITYKDYTALLEVDVLSGTIVGHVIGIRDEIVFEGKTAEEAVEGFHRSVDYYLGRLAESGQTPERPFSGRFNVRIDSETHRALVLDAEARQISLNDVVKRAFTVYLSSTAGAKREEQANAASLSAEPPRTRKKSATKSLRKAPGPVAGKPRKENTPDSR